MEVLSAFFVHYSNGGVMINVALIGVDTSQIMLADYSSFTCVLSLLFYQLWIHFFCAHIHPSFKIQHVNWKFHFKHQIPLYIYRLSCTKITGFVYEYCGHFFCGTYIKARLHCTLKPVSSVSGAGSARPHRNHLKGRLQAASGNIFNC